MNELSKSCVMTHYVSGVPATDGAGVKLTRMIGTPELDMVDPFLMLDRMDSDDPNSYIAGVPIIRVNLTPAPSVAGTPDT